MKLEQAGSLNALKRTEALKKDVYLHLNKASLTVLY